MHYTRGRESAKLKAARRLFEPAWREAGSRGNEPRIVQVRVVAVASTLAVTPDEVGPAGLSFALSRPLCEASWTAGHV